MTLDEVRQLVDAHWVKLAVGLGSAGLTWIAGRFRNRRTRLRWSVQHRDIAVATDHPDLPKIQVLINGTSVRRLHYSEVHVVNDSGTDLGPFDLTVTASAPSTIYTEEAGIAGDTLRLRWTE
jgi:hypothetical protein